jgi:hypothetical protein
MHRILMAKSMMGSACLLVTLLGPGRREQLVLDGPKGGEALGGLPSTGGLNGCERLLFQVLIVC